MISLLREIQFFFTVEILKLHLKHGNGIFSECQHTLVYEDNFITTLIIVVE